jgi:tetratricopeptide (TPR) repeat protein
MSYRAFLAVFPVLATLAYAQQQPPPYTAEEYKAFQAATTEADPAKRIELILTFLKDRPPQSPLRPHVLAAYQQVLKDFQTGEKWAETVSVGDRFLAMVPEDIFTISMLATAHQKLGHNKEFTAYGEKVFAQSPSGNLAYYLAKAYQSLGDDAKFFEYGEKVATLMPDNHEILITLTEKLSKAKKAPQAAKYARQCLTAIKEATRPAATPEATWREYVNYVNAVCYATIGNFQYDRKDYAGAISSLESSLRHSAKNQIAYYFLAQSYWQQSKIDLAMKNFAKAYLIKGPVSAAAKQYLDNLYKTTHGNSLVGQDRVIEKARMELPK